MITQTLINELRLKAEDIHLVNPSSETVKLLSTAADELGRMHTLLNANAVSSEDDWTELQRAQAERNRYRDALLDVIQSSRTKISMKQKAREVLFHNAGNTEET